MYVSVQQALLSCKVSSDNTATNVAITERNYTNTDFLTVHFLCSSLADGKKVLFVSLREPFTHFCTIAAKTGTNLLTHYKNANIKVIEGLKLMREAATLSAESERQSQHPFNFVYGKKSLKFLHVFIKQLIHDWQRSNKEYVIIIDSLASLLAFGIPVIELQRFTAYCNSLTLSNNGFDIDDTSTNVSRLGSLIVTSRDCPSDADCESLKHFLWSSFDATLALEGLSTGRSSEVDGCLRVSYYPHHLRRQSCKHKLFHYKVYEKDIKVFAPGMAASVI